MPNSFYYLISRVVDEGCDDDIEVNYLDAGNAKREDCPMEPGAICEIAKTDAISAFVTFKCNNGKWIWTGKFQKKFYAPGTVL